MRLNSIYEIKPQFQSMLHPAAAHLAGRGITADQLTAAGIGIAAIAGLVAAFSGGGAWLALLPVLYVLRMAVNAMDGLVAREFGTPSWRGRWFNETGDIVGDAAAYLPWLFIMPDPASAVLLVTAVVAGLVAETTSLIAVTEGPRPNHGPFGKSDRAGAFGFVAVVWPVVHHVAWMPLAVMVGLGLVTIRRRLAAVTEGSAS